ncbi:hypothetical protein [Antrihabitans sp. YC2-6]|uniref:hypothetical protein n=1 Tax=Antrihabitans sp. YC2-6 TaxID=2799498 RepID=UPI0027DB0AE2|nr:hypothetical protein [Antrihabitans sp. YC2-6]
MPGPPFSVELLADLHADNLPPEVADQLWPVVLQDADAVRILDSLDQATTVLGALGQDSSIGIPIPPDVAARIDQALSAPSNVVPITSSRRRRWIVTTAAAASVAAAIAIVFTAVTLNRPAESQPSAAPESSAVLELPSELPIAMLLSVQGRDERPGALADPAVLRSCFAANGLSPTAPVLGSAPVRFRDQDAVLLLTAAEPPAHVLALVVGTGCDESDPQVLATRSIG